MKALNRDAVLVLRTIQIDAFRKPHLFMFSMNNKTAAMFSSVYAPPPPVSNFPSTLQFRDTAFLFAC